MSAIVTSDEDEDWYTNSRAWSIILERARCHLSDTDREEFEKHVNPIGVDFTLIERARRSQVARWLLEPIESLCGPEGAEEGWDAEVDRNHLEALAVMLQRMAQA